MFTICCPLIYSSQFSVQVWYCILIESSQAFFCKLYGHPLGQIGPSWIRIRRRIWGHPPWTVSWSEFGGLLLSIHRWPNWLGCRTISSGLPINGEQELSLLCNSLINQLNLVLHKIWLGSILVFW